MLEELLKAIPVYLSSMLKFILGPFGGYAAGLHIITTIVATVLGMMTIVLVLTYAGNWLKRNVFPRLFHKKPHTEGKFVHIWKKYGLTGVALLTPVILTPIGGTLLALSSGSPKEKIILYMALSAVLWSVVFSVTIYFFGNQVLPDFIKPG
jgi:membrane protein DedA with SNARE-associated domain